jgi:glucan phosphoethanolaminetransferase (alkaline phosphatase superfamily)
MIIKIMDGLKIFLGILTLVIIFFCGSFVVLYQEFDKERQGYDSFSTFPMAFIHVYGFLYGSYSAELMFESSNYVAAVIIGSAFMFFVVIVMLNILIAIISDRYSYVKENENAEFNYGLAKIIVEYEKLIPEKIKLNKMQEWYPKYLHVLKRVNQFKKRPVNEYH